MAPARGQCLPGRWRVHVCAPGPARHGEHRPGTLYPFVTLLWFNSTPLSRALTCLSRWLVLLWTSSHIALLPLIPLCAAATLLHSMCSPRLVSAGVACLLRRRHMRACSDQRPMQIHTSSADLQTGRKAARESAGKGTYSALALPFPSHSCAATALCLLRCKAVSRNQTPLQMAGNACSVELWAVCWLLPPSSCSTSVRPLRRCCPSASELNNRAHDWGGRCSWAPGGQAGRRAGAR